MCEFTVLMPCLNEIKSLPFCIGEAKEYIKSRGLSAEILIADNGSRDGSAEAAKALGARVVHVSRRGYGAALRAGIDAAYGKYIIMGDCDGSYDFSDLDAFVARLREGYGLVVGNRFLGGIEKGAMPCLHKIGVPVLSLLGRLVSGARIGDFHCGLRGFSTESARELGLRCDGMEFASEIICRFVQSGAKICEVPTVLRRDLRGRKPHLRTFRDGMRHVIYLLRQRKR